MPLDAFKGPQMSLNFTKCLQMPSNIKKPFDSAGNPASDIKWILSNSSRSDLTVPESLVLQGASVLTERELARRSLL